MCVCVEQLRAQGHAIASGFDLENYFVSEVIFRLTTSTASSSCALERGSLELGSIRVPVYDCSVVLCCPAE